MPSGPRIRANNVYGIISDNPLTIGATTFNSSGLAVLPDVSSAHAVVVLDPKRVFGEPEIVVVTAHTALTTSATIVRAQYGTVARSHPVNTSWAHVPINEDFIEICTTSTHPSNPYVGQLIFETDLLTYKSWNGVAWVDVGSGAAIFQDASPPPGPTTGTLWLDTDEGAATGLSSIIGYSQSTTTQTGVGAETDVTGCSVNITVPAGRRIKVVGRIEVGSPSVNLNAFLLIKEGATEIGRAAAVVNTATESTLTAEAIISPTAGNHTYKLTLQTNTGTINTSNITNAPNYILVEDITGTLWPAGTTFGAASFASEAWTSFVPTLTQSGSVTFTNTYSRYLRLGRLIIAETILTVTGAGTGGVKVSVGIPFNGVQDNVVCGSFHLVDVSAVTNYTGTAFMEGTNTVIGIANAQGAGFGQASFTAALAAGDVVRYSIMYEAAS